MVLGNKVSLDSILSFCTWGRNITASSNASSMFSSVLQNPSTRNTLNTNFWTDNFMTVDNYVPSTVDRIYQLNSGVHSSLMIPVSATG